MTSDKHLVYYEGPVASDSPCGLDVQDSRWLRLVTRQVRLVVTIAGGGSVEGDVPGIECSASCATEWDQGSEVVLDALPAEGQRFVRWTGGCTGTDTCSLTLGSDRAVTALFAPERFPLTLSVVGRGSVTGASAAASPGAPGA